MKIGDIVYIFRVVSFDEETVCVSEDGDGVMFRQKDEVFLWRPS